ncbi:MAG: hypothetical protein LBE24_08905 [Methylobacillus sp.]|jgi:hypothetical protein|nr:hypothetical protein [Methylobacillus sp.]
MFELLPPPAASAAGSLACRVEISHAMSGALKGLDRYDVAAKMSRLLGRDISKHMLDAYTAESREDHTPPLDTAIAFDLATETHTLANLFSTKLGARLLIGKEALHAELGRLQRTHDEAAQKMKQLKRIMRELK